MLWLINGVDMKDCKELVLIITISLFSLSLLWFYANDPACMDQVRARNAAIEQVK